MSRIVDFNEAKRARQAPASARAPDFEMYGWLENGELDQLSWKGEFLEDTKDHGVCTAGLIDAAWMFGKNAYPESDLSENDRPLFWWLLQGDGTHTFLYSTSLFEGTSVKHACWFVRQWWRLTKKCAHLTWRILWGKA